MHPAGRIDGFPGPDLVIPIAEHDRVSPGAQLPGFAARHQMPVAVDNLDFEMRLYPSDRRHTKLQRIVAAALKADRTGFGHPVGDRYLAHVHLRRDFLHDLDRARRSGHDAAAKRAQIEAREFRVVELGNEHGGYAVEHVATLRRDRFQRLQRIEGLGRIDHRRRMGHTAEIAHHHAKAVVQRHGNAYARARLDPRRFTYEEGIVDQVMMRKRRALRQSGGAAGELDVDGVVDLDRSRYGFKTLVAGLPASLQDRVERRAAVVLSRDRDDVSQFRKTRAIAVRRLRLPAQGRARGSCRYSRWS